MSRTTLYRITLIVTCLFMVAIGTIGSFPVSTVSAQSQQSNAISRSFRVGNETVAQGALVSTVSDDSSRIELATTGTAGRLAGIVSKSALVELSDGNTAETQVILSGVALGLVSDINGQIRAGDKITASPIKGVGMLADSDAQIVGTAQADYKPTDSQRKAVKDKQGKEHTVHVGTIPLQVGISYYVAPTSQFVPPFLQNIANTIAGRPVSFMRIILSCILLLLAFGSIFVLIYTSVRSGLISLGRNPLAARAIHRGLVGVVVIVLSVAVLAILGVYFILTT